MHHTQAIDRVIDLTDPSHNVLLNGCPQRVRAGIAAGDVEVLRQLDGHFAFVTTQGQFVRMARSIGRPLRYFIAKRAEGPALIAAERIDQIYDWLRNEGLADQFHPSYTRMVPAHYITEVALVGCPDPNPRYQRFFHPQRNRLEANPEAIGPLYIRAVHDAVLRWLQLRATTGPIGVCFSGGIDSGAVFLVVYHALLQLGQSPSRLKAFTLTLDNGPDLVQARRFLDALGLGFFLEPITVRPEQIDWREAVRTVEDYKPLDIQSATMSLALCQGIRARYPDWRYLIDGEGGDENLKDYPIEENPELTIRSVVNNLMLYQEGWGVDAIKHSLTYSGGLSRGYVRAYAPATRFGFEGFSPFTLPSVIEIAEGIPFDALTGGSHEKLYRLKGAVVAAGIKAVTGFDMPVFDKRRFQHGVAGEGRFAELFPAHPSAYRRAFQAIYD
jgi:asparagine synthase (glutamine-hydrolysing)